MKKFILFSLMLTTLPLIAQTEVNSFFSGTNEGATYCLPDTRIEITVNAVCITHTLGEFNRYAERFLRINNAITEAASHWEITGIEVKTCGIPNPEKMYTIKFNGSTACNINLCRDGIIKSINVKEQEEKKETGSTQQPPGGSNSIDATQYMTEEMLQSTSTAKLAELTAKEIYSIRESKLAIIRGESENMPKDGHSMQLVLSELEKQEKAFTELFTGHADTIYNSRTYSIEPALGNDTAKAIMFRFSRKLGFVDKEDLAGEPIYYSLHDLKTVHIPAQNEPEKKRVLKKEGICYNIPGKADFALFTRSRKLFNAELGIAQFGTTEILSKDFFNKKNTTRVIFDTSTGGIISIEKQQ